jgi:hypothetical protein
MLALDRGSFWLNWFSVVKNFAHFGSQPEKHRLAQRFAHKSLPNVATLC